MAGDWIAAVRGVAAVADAVRLDDAAFAIRARLSAAAIFSCWLMSELLVGAGSVDRRTICSGSEDSARGSFREPALSDGAPDSEDAICALRLRRSPNITTAMPAQLPIVQSRRSPATLRLPMATAEDVMKEPRRTTDIVPLAYNLRPLQKLHVTLVIGSG